MAKMTKCRILGNIFDEICTLTNEKKTLLTAKSDPTNATECVLKSS